MKRFLFLILIIILTVSVASSSATKPWVTLENSSNYTGSLDKTIKLPMLSSGILSLGGETNLVNNELSGYTSELQNSHAFLNRQGNLSENIDVYSYKYHQFDPFTGYRVTDIGRDSKLLEKVNVKTGEREGWITSSFPIFGTNKVTRDIHEIRDGEYWRFSQIWDDNGLLWTLPAFRDGDGLLALSPEYGYIPTDIFDLRNGETLNIEATDGKIAYEYFSKDSDKRYRVFEYDNPENTIGFLPYGKVKIKNDYIEVGEARYSRDDCSFIENILCNFDYDKRINPILDTYKNFLLMQYFTINQSEINGEVQSGLKVVKRVVDGKTGKTIFEKPHHNRNYNNNETVYFGEVVLRSHFAIHIDDFKIEYYDLDKIDKQTGEPELVKIIPHPRKVELIKNNNEFLIISFDGEGVKISSLDPNNLRIIPNKSIYIPDVPEFSWEFDSQNIITPNETGVWFLDCDMQHELQMKHYEWNALIPDQIIPLQNEIKGYPFSACWWDGELFVATRNNDETTVYSFDQNSSDGKIIYETSTKNQFKQMKINENFLVLYSPYFGVVFINRKTGEVNKAKRINFRGGSIILVGNFLLIHTPAGGDVMINFTNNEQLEYRGLMGIVDDNLFIITPKAGFVISVNTFTGEEKVVTDSPHSSFDYGVSAGAGKNIFLTANYFMNKNYEKIQKTLQFRRDCYISLDSSMFFPHKDDLLIRVKGSIYKLSPCPAYSVKQVECDEKNKVSFEFATTRDDNLANPLTGNAYIIPWGEKPVLTNYFDYENPVELEYTNIPSAPVWGKLDGEKVEIKPMVSGMKQTLTLNLPSPNSAVQHPEIGYSDNPSDLKYFALVIESNGLLDTNKSELSEADDTKRTLFDGTPISLESQQSIVLTIWRVE